MIKTRNPFKKLELEDKVKAYEENKASKDKKGQTLQ